MDTAGGERAGSRVSRGPHRNQDARTSTRTRTREIRTTMTNEIICNNSTSDVQTTDGPIMTLLQRPSSKYLCNNMYTYRNDAVLLLFFFLQVCTSRHLQSCDKNNNNNNYIIPINKMFLHSIQWMLIVFFVSTL